MKIKEGIAQLCFECHYRFEATLNCWEDLTDNEKEWWLNYAKQILRFLKENGLVQVVKRELPEYKEVIDELEATAHCCQWFDREWYYAGQSQGHQDMLKWHKASLKDLEVE